MLTPEPCAPARPPSGVDARTYWNSRLDALDWLHPASDAGDSWRRGFETFLAPDTREALGMLGDLDRLRVLDLACGTGQSTWHLARLGAQAIGLDLAHRRCAQGLGRRVPDAVRGSASFCAGRAESLPFADGSFDAIFARDVLMYADIPATLRECRRLLSPGGRVVFIEALRGNPLLHLYRRRTSPRDYETFTRHLSWDELAQTAPPLELVERRPYYLTALLSFAALFVLRSVRLHQILLAILAPLDAWLLRCAPGLAGFAWRGAVLLRRHHDEA